MASVTARSVEEGGKGEIEKKRKCMIVTRAEGRGAAAPRLSFFARRPLAFREAIYFLLWESYFPKEEEGLLFSHSLVAEARHSRPKNETLIGNDRGPSTFNLRENCGHQGEEGFSR